MKSNSLKVSINHRLLTLCKCYDSQSKCYDFILNFQFICVVNKIKIARTQTIKKKLIFKMHNSFINLPVKRKGLINKVTYL